MTESEFTEALRLHRAYVFGEEQGMIANFEGKDLRGKSFKEQLLIGAIFNNANCSGCDFTRAEMSYIDAKSAIFDAANFKQADLIKSNLEGASFEDANLDGVTGNGRQIVSMLSERWPVAYTATHIQIGCERHTIDDWWSFDDERIKSMSKHALAWWKKWKPVLQQAIKKKPAKAA